MDIFMYELSLGLLCGIVGASVITPVYIFHVIYSRSNYFQRTMMEVAVNSQRWSLKSAPIKVVGKVYLFIRRYTS